MTAAAAGPPLRPAGTGSSPGRNAAGPAEGPSGGVTGRPGGPSRIAGIIRVIVSGQAQLEGFNARVACGAAAPVVASE